jgi:asparagine synthase (glutamine-hydrolysing)
LSFLPQMVRLQDEPIADPVCVPVYYVSKLARDNGVIVAQVGEGADELFWGYPAWKTYRNLARWNDAPVPRAAKRAGVALATRAGKGTRREVEFLRRASLGQPVFWSGAEAFTQAQKERLLAPRLRASLDGLTSWEAIKPLHDRWERGRWEASHLSWMSFADLNLRLPELLLMRVDKMSMGVSLEGRVPFLDHKFVELVMSIPTEVKYHRGELKRIMKKAVRGTIPDEIIDRPKKGFAVPVNEWLAEALGVEARREVKSFCEQSDLLDWKAVEPVMMNEKWRAPSWILLNLALWWKHSIAPERA